MRARGGDIGVTSKVEPQDSSKDESEPDTARPHPRIRLFGNHYRIPQSILARRFFGVALVVLGFFGFLPVLGFWMIPLGLIVLSYDSHVIRRWRRRLSVSFGRRNGGGKNGNENGIR